MKRPLSAPAMRTTITREQRLGYIHPFELTDPTTPQNHRFSLKESHDFCGKACAIYCTTDIDGQPQADLYDHVYKIWYPFAPSNLDYGPYAAKCIACWYSTSPKDLAGIIQAHQALSAQVSGLQREKVDPDSWDFSFEDYPEKHDRYEFLPMFRDVLIIVDGVNWKEDNALLVLCDSSMGAALDDSRQAGFHDQGNGFSTLRASLAKIIEIIMRMLQREDDLEKAAARTTRQLVPQGQGFPVMERHNSERDVLAKL